MVSIQDETCFQDGGRRVFRTSNLDQLPVGDPNPDLLRFVSSVFERKGWTVAISNSARGAAEAIRKSQEAPNIALVYYNLPDANGLYLGIKLQSQTPNMASSSHRTMSSS